MANVDENVMTAIDAEVKEYYSAVDENGMTAYDRFVKRGEHINAYNEACYDEEGKYVSIEVLSELGSRFTADYVYNV